MFFADPSKPTWRRHVLRISDATVGISVAAVRLSGATPAAPHRAPFPGSSHTLPAEPTVHDEVAKDPAGEHTRRCRPPSAPRLVARQSPAEPR